MINVAKMSKVLVGLICAAATEAALASTVTIHADGAVHRYDLSGADGSSGIPGAPGCDGGSGGNGENGGDGDDAIVYYDQISDLQKIYINDSGGSGGAGGLGGVGGSGCMDGDLGSMGGSGANGASGAYGDIYLVQGTTAIQPSHPSDTVDMAKLDGATVALSQNVWTRKTGARSLFMPGSDIRDSYDDFQSRAATTVTLHWAAAQPASAFAGQLLQVSLQAGQVSVTAPDGLLVQSEIVQAGAATTVTIKAVLQPAETTSLQIGSLDGNKADLKLHVDDLAKVSDIVQSSVVQLTYFALVSGQYQVVFQGVVPASALTVTAEGIDVALGGLGINAADLSPGAQVYVGLTVRRTFLTAVYDVNLGNYFVIPTFSQGDQVQVIQDANLYSGSTVVGHLSKGDKLKVLRSQGPWVLLQQADGTTAQGWVQASDLQLAP